MTSWLNFVAIGLCLWRLGQAKLHEEFVVLGDCHLDRLFGSNQITMRCFLVYLRLTHRRADVAEDAQVEVILLNLGHFDPAAISLAISLDGSAGIDEAERIWEEPTKTVYLVNPVCVFGGPRRLVWARNAGRSAG